MPPSGSSMRAPPYATLAASAWTGASVASPCGSPAPNQSSAGRTPRRASRFRICQSRRCPPVASGQGTFGTTKRTRAPTGFSRDGGQLPRDEILQPVPERDLRRPAELAPGTRHVGDEVLALDWPSAQRILLDPERA